MPDIVPVEANVGISDVVGGQTTEIAQAGEAISRGQVYYKDPTTAYLAKCDDPDKLGVVGVAITAADADGWFVGVTSGRYAVGASVSIPDDYVLSATAGSICPRSDLVTGDTVVEIFNAASTTEGILKINNTGVVVP